MNELCRQSFVVYRRSLRHARRNPIFAFVFPGVVPVALLALFSQIYGGLAHVPGFPASNYVSWLAPGVFLMAAMFGAQYSAQGLVDDLRSGYLDRLRLLPVRPAALMFGRLAFDVTRVAIGGALVLAASIALGATWHGGILGAAGLFLLLALWTLAYGGAFYLVGLRTRSTEAMMALIPLFLPVSMLSTAYAPKTLLPGWLRWAADINPYSRVVDGVRMFATGQFSAGRLGLAVAAAAGVLALVQLGAARAFAALVHTD